MASSSKMGSFTKCMKKGYSNAMPIPKAVYDTFSGGILRGTVILELGSKSWQVEVSSGSFTEGWNSFWSENALKEDETVLFRHLLGRRFSVELFNSDGAPKEERAGKKRARGKEVAEVENEVDHSENEGTKGDTIEDMIKDCLVHLDEHSSLKFLVTKIPRVEVHQQREPSTPSRIVQNVTTKSPRTDPVRRSLPRTAPVLKTAPEPEPVASPEEFSPSKRAKTVPPKRGANTKGTPDAARRSRRKTAVVSKLTMPEPQPVETPKEREDQPEEQVETSGRKPRKGGKKRKATPAKKASVAKKTVEEKKPVATEAPDSPTVARARALKSDLPSTAIVMKKSNVAPCFYLNIPKDFAKKHLPEDTKEFDMVDETNKAWGVKWLGPPKCAFSGGWCYFVQDHSIKIHDVCVLEIFNSDRVKVTVLKASTAGPSIADTNGVANDDGLANADDENAPRPGTNAEVTNGEQEEAAEEDEEDDEDYDPKEDDEDEDAADDKES